jgi:cyclophilin family peptidyl-prolyl cis-trans isomerase
MKKSLLLISMLTLVFLGCKSFKYPVKDSKGEAIHYIQISTTYGNMVVRLYNETPKHRDNIMALAKAHYYDSLVFHRVIKDFMMQGGSCDARNAAPNIALGNCDSGYTVPAEILPNFFHKKGTLCAARTNNPEKASSATQFYISQGKVYTANELKAFAQSRGITLNEEQTRIYTTIGGIPQLDGAYTVYGEVVEGINVVDSICNSATSPQLQDRPVRDVKMAIKVLR